MFRLAYALGRTVGELLDSISSAELTEWMAFDQLEPFGYATDSLRAGQICAVIANVNRPKETSKKWKASDFVVIDGEVGGGSRPGESESAKSMWAKAWMITELYRAAKPGGAVDGNSR